MARTLTLRDVPEGIVRALRERAKRNHRSMQKEILSILERSVIDRAALRRVLAGARAGNSRPMGLDEIHEGIDEGRP